MHLDVMAGGERLREVQDLARGVQQAGLSGIVFTERGRTAYLAATAAALAADGLDIGTGIAVAFPRSPMVTAQMAWELAELTDGRFHLGLGTQVRAHIERRYSAPFDPPGPRLREYILALRAIFRAFQAGDPLDVHGRFYDLSLLPAEWSPGPVPHPEVPILVAAVGPWMLRMAGEVADGVHVHPLHSRRYLDEILLPTVAEGAAGAGRDPSELRLVVPVLTAVGDGEEERARWRERARQQVAFYGSTRNYAHIFDQLGFEGTSARLNERLKARDLPGMSRVITDEMLDAYTVTATWDDVAEQLLERYGDVADRVVVYFAADAWREDPTTLARWGEVAGALRQADRARAGAPAPGTPGRP